MWSRDFLAVCWLVRPWALVCRITFENGSQVSSDNRARQCGKFQHLQKHKTPLSPAHHESHVAAHRRQFLELRKPFVPCLQGCRGSLTEDGQNPEVMQEIWIHSDEGRKASPAVPVT
jgi:hypothetical protein